MKEIKEFTASTKINQTIAARVRQLRLAKNMSLEQLAQASEVSRSMLSVIERGEASPTAVVLEKIATGLGGVLVDLFETQPVADPIARAKNNLAWRDSQSGYIRRNVSPSSAITPIQIVEVAFPPKATVAYESGARSNRIHEQVWVLSGCMDIRVGKQKYQLEAGDCLAFVVDQPITFFNPGAKVAKYAVVIVAQA